jgi:hypothetical protein
MRRQIVATSGRNATGLVLTFIFSGEFVTVRPGRAEHDAPLPVAG